AGRRAVAEKARAHERRRADGHAAGGGRQAEEERAPRGLGRAARRLQRAGGGGAKLVAQPAVPQPVGAGGGPVAGLEVGGAGTSLAAVAAGAARGDRARDRRAAVVEVSDAQRRLRSAV